MFIGARSSARLGVQVALAWLAWSPATTIAATITNLGILPNGTNSYGYAVNADGSTVAGYGGTPGGPQAFRWTIGGGMEGLQTFQSTSYAFGLNHDGNAVTGYTNGPAGPIAFRWVNGAVDNLGTFGGIFGFSIGYGISGDGTAVVGDAGTFSGDRAFLWTQPGGLQNLGVLPGDSQSRARSVSADGSVVAGLSGFHAFRWTNATGMQDIGVLQGYGGSQALAISDDGSVIAGFSYHANGLEQAFRWTESGGLQSLGGPSSRSEGYAISGDGTTIAGTMAVGTGLYHAFLWHEEHGMVDLNSYLTTLGVDLTGWELTSASSLSFDGSAIVGSGTFNGEDRAWLVTGVPEPSTLGLLTVGALAVLRRRSIPRP